MSDRNSATASVTLENNRITGVSVGPFDAMQLAGNWNGTTGTTVNFSGNVLVDSAGISGFNLSNVTGAIANNTFDGISYYALLLANDTDVDVTGNTFANIVNPDPSVATWGAGVRTYTPGSGFGLNLDGNTFTGNAVGLGIRAGSVIAPGAVTITNNTFDGNANVVVNQGTATTDVVLAGNNAVDTVQLSGATEAQLLALADHIVDAVDNASYGSVVLKDGHVYLTANSFFAPGTTTPSLQRAVDTAQAGDTIHVGAGAYSDAATTAVDNLTVTAPAGATGLALTLGAGVLNITLLGASNIDVTGNGLANIIAGNAGINALDGGAGDDTALYTTPLAFGAVVANGAGWTVAGGDTLSDIEIVQHAGGRYLLVGNGGFGTAAAAALAATQAGDTIKFAVEPAPDVPIEINLADDDEDIELVVPYDTPVDITTGDGDNDITTGGGDDVVETGAGMT